MQAIAKGTQLASQIIEVARTSLGPNTHSQLATVEGQLGLAIAQLISSGKWSSGHPGRSEGAQETEGGTNSPKKRKLNDDQKGNGNKDYGIPRRPHKWSTKGIVVFGSKMRLQGDTYWKVHPAAIKSLNAADCKNVTTVVLVHDSKLSNVTRNAAEVDAKLPALEKIYIYTKSTTDLATKDQLGAIPKAFVITVENTSETTILEEIAKIETIPNE